VLATRERAPLPSYTDEEEESVARNVERIKYYKDKGGSHATLVTETMAKTLDVLPSKDRIKFLYAVTVLLALTLGRSSTSR
jgi:hypothetical protein